jgi:dTDP-4-dehydrorhamnose reductase
MKVLVTGARGMLGTTLMRVMDEDREKPWQVVGVDLPDGDLTSEGTAASLLQEHRPEWVVHCAAWTRVDDAETHEAEALAINGRATALLAAACDEAGCGLTYLSTDYVFDGEGPAEGYTEEYPRSPLNAYGRTKAAGEEAVEAMVSPWQIIRISWLFGDGPVNFPRTIRRLLGERETLKVVNDQHGCPTYAEDLCRVLTFLVSGRHRGIFHATNSGSCTWYDVACEVARLVGTDPGRIHACPSSEYPTLAKRPRISVLRSRALEEAGCAPRPAWQDGLARYIALLERK